MAAFDPAMFQDALLQVAEATRAATVATTQVLQQQQQQAITNAPASSSGPSIRVDRVDRSKLIARPVAFEHKSIEEEIRAYRDWSWQLVQYLNAIDQGFERELKMITEDPTTALDMSTAGAEVRQRSSKLYGLLASLVKNKALNIVRSVDVGDGYEALRQMTLALRPTSNNRGLALLSALTSWTPFQMNQPLQPQLLRVQEVMEEARRAGSTVPDQLKQAVLMKALSGQLRTHINLSIDENTTYSSLRESVLRWDRGQQKWSGLVFANDTGDAMEIDRLKGKKGQKGKGKGNDWKGDGKSKGKGKTKSKENGKGGSKGKGKKGEGKTWVEV